MSGDFALAQERAMLAWAKHWAPITDLIPAGSLYRDVPADRTFPFGRLGTPVATPFRASGLNASTSRINWQAFGKPVTDDNGAIIETARDRITRIGSAFKEAFDGKTIAIEGGGKLLVTWLSTSPRIDGDEADAWMTTVTFLAEVLAN